MKLKNIKKHWEEAGNKFLVKGGSTPTSRDQYLALLERNNILSCLKRSNSLLEIGCGDGSNTIHYSRKVKKILGVDIAESLLNIAKSKMTAEAINNVDFAVGSVLDIDRICGKRRFSSVISQRCLINLPEWKHKQEAIVHAHALLRDKGSLLLTEGFQEELDNLNSLRLRFGLPEIKVVNYNSNFVRRDFEKFIKKYFEIVEVRHYGIYMVLSRLFHPLAVLPDKPRHDSKLNEIAMEFSSIFDISDFAQYSYNLFYVLRKK